MNALVLAIAGVLVVVGIALIVLSIVLARKRPRPEEQPSDLPAPALDAGPAFIDLPLQADMSAALGHSEPDPVQPEPAEPEPAEPEPAEPEPADDDPTGETVIAELRTQNDTGGTTRPDKED